MLHNQRLYRQQQDYLIVIRRFLSNKNFNSTISKEDVGWMQLAIEVAKKGEKANNVPVGAVLIARQSSFNSNGNNKLINSKHSELIIHSAHNVSNHALQHAEMLVLNEYLSNIENNNIETCLYVTLEPCPMCAYAIRACRINRVCYGTKSPKLGGDGSWVNILQGTGSILKPIKQIQPSVCEEECKILMESFFKKIRLEN